MSQTTNADQTAAADAFYHAVGVDEFTSTAATESPWDDSMQHGGPPAALLARAVERVRPDPDMQIARITIDMLGPIPQGRTRTEAHIVRPGRRVELIEAKLWVNDRVAVTATAWRIRRASHATPASIPARSVPPLPDPQEQSYLPGVSPGWGYGAAIEWRFVHGSYTQPGPADVWARVRIPLVAGEDTSPVQRLAIVADSANGLSAELPLSEWLFVPPSLTLTITRPPAGSWINLAVRTLITNSGIGTSLGDIADTDGMIGSLSQPLLIAPRAGQR